MKYKSSALGSSKRAYGVGGQARFVNPPATEPDKRDQVALSANHPAITEARTIFKSRVFDAGARNHVLIPGINSAKTGNQIVVGPWSGFRQYNLSLEERATCPLTCGNFDTCFGNKMPMAVRFNYNSSLMMSLDGELYGLSERHPEGFAVRLHILGDFPDVEYLRRWCEWSDEFSNLHIWGYTAHSPTSEIGAFIAKANDVRPDRWRIRFSVPEGTPHGPMQVATTWDKPTSYSFDRKTSSMICPQEIGKTAHCATCGICWKPELSHVRVIFMGHGGRMGRKRSDDPPVPAPILKIGRRPVVFAPIARTAPSLDELVRQAVMRGAVTKIPEKTKRR